MLQWLLQKAAIVNEQDKLEGGERAGGKTDGGNCLGIGVGAGRQSHTVPNAAGLSCFPTPVEAYYGLPPTVRVLASASIFVKW